MTQTETELLQGLQLTFPIDNSFSGCYKDRQSCLDRDLPSEVDISESPHLPLTDFSQIDLLVGNLLSFRGLMTDWIGFSETIRDFVQETEY